MSFQSPMHRPSSPPPAPSLGRDLCRAISRATGISRVRSATIDGDSEGVTVVRMEFIASEKLLRLVGNALSEHSSASTVGLPATGARDVEL